MKKNRLLVTLFFIIVGGYSAYNYAYKPHEIIEELDIHFKGTTIEFLEKASQNFSDWNTKIVELSGKVTTLDKAGFTLNNQIYCQLKNIENSSLIIENQTIKIKGRVIGYDDLLDELKIEQCILK
ncbi:hypothetical protein OAT18_02695 [Tenacibaculum sp.]|nr:hypothetical protein [Tenacibaculum sp.]